MSYVTRGRVLVGSCLGLLAGAIYATIIYPMQNASKFRAIQEVTREGIDREEIQPGGMRIWSDPFKEKPKEVPQFLPRAQRHE